MQKQKNPTPTTQKDAEKAVSRKLTPSELDHISGGTIGSDQSTSMTQLQQEQIAFDLKQETERSFLDVGSY